MTSRDASPIFDHGRVVCIVSVCTLTCNEGIDSFPSEKEREANIARNRALLEQLDLKDASSSLGLPPKPAPKPKAKPIQPIKKPKREQIDRVPRRQSARLKKEAIDPNETPAQRRKREAEAQKRKREKEEERIAAEEQAMLAKRPRTHELDLVELIDAEELDDSDTSAFRRTFQAVTNNPMPRRVGSVRDWVFDRNDKDKEEVRSLRERLGKMKIVARAKVTENRVYSAAYHPEPSKDLIFFGGGYDFVNIYTTLTRRAKISTANLEYGMREHFMTKSPMKMKIFLQLEKEKEGSIGVSNSIGQQQQSLPFPASSSIL